MGSSFQQSNYRRKKGQRGAPCASSKIGHQSMVNFFFAGLGATNGFSTTVSSTFVGSRDGADSAAGAGSWNKSVNLLIVVIEFYKIIYYATSSTNSPRIRLFIFLVFKL